MDPEGKPTKLSTRVRTFLFKNQTNKQTVAKNSFWLTVSNFGGRLVKAGVIVYGARILGTSGWGVFSYAITLSGFLTLFMDPGLNNIIMREIGRADDEKRHTLFSTTLAMKIVLLLAGVAVVIFIAPHFSTLPGAKALLPIVALILGLDTLREFLTSYARGMERMEFDAAIFILTNFGILVLGFIFLTLAKTPAALAWAYVGGDILGIALAVFITRTFFKKISRYFSPRLIIPIIQSAWPFAVTSALALLLTNTDILIISWIKNASAVGIYSSAIRIIQVLYLIPTIFQFSTLPLFARFANKDDAPKFRGALEQTIGLIFLASIPLAIGGVILGAGIMSFIFGSAYAAGGTSFKILSVGLMFDFPAVVISSAIFAYNRQKSLIIAAAIAGGINVAFDILLIPHWGINGSSTATLIAQIASNWYLWHMMKKINYFTVLPSLKKIGIASIVMAIVIGALYVFHANVVIAIIVGALIYFGMLRLLREPLLIEIKRVLKRAGAVEAAA